MSLTFPIYDELLHSIYDAALRPMNWPEVVRRIAEACAAPRALLFTYAHPHTQGGFAFPHNLPQWILERWAAVRVHDDPFVHAAERKGLVVEGMVMTDIDLVTQEALQATDFYKELWAPVDVGRLCTGVVFDATDAHKLPTALSLYRSRAEAAFDAHEVALMKRLVSHLSRALGVMFHLRDRELQVASSVGALDRLPAGVVLLDRAMRVAFANRAAHEMLRSGETVRLNRPSPNTPERLGLHPRLATQEGALKRMLEQAVQPLAHDAPEHFFGALVVHGDDGRPACVMHAAPLTPDNGLPGSNQACAIVFLYDLDRAAAVPTELLTELFDMTAAEARAARQVVLGGTAEDMARRLGVSVSTFKTQLQAAYAKSRTHRQADLLKLLLAVSAR